MRRVIQRQVTTIKIVSITLTWADEDDATPPPPSNGALLMLPEPDSSDDPEDESGSRPAEAADEEA
jgi:hypothetical protein